jgi:sigma-B regulation protein RsbU (phosphoserine phosphatase)
MFASIDITSGAIDCVNAGHKLPYILKAGGEIELVEVPYGTMLGTDEEATFESRSLALSPGEVLFLYTDGMTSVFDSHRHQFSIERLEEALIVAADQPVSELVDHLMNAIESFVGEADYEDDLTCLAIKREK